jgi:hypothetical protein
MKLHRIAIVVEALFLLGAAVAMQAQAQSTSSAEKPSKGAPPAPISSDAAAAKGRSIVLAAAKAAGDANTLRSLKNIEIATKGQATSQNGPIDISLKLTVAYPNRLHTTADLPGIKIQQVFDGEHGWVISPQGAIDLPPDYDGEFQRGIALTGGFGLYREALDGKKLDLQYIDDEDFDDKPASAVKWTGPSGPVKLYFDPATHLLSGAHFRSVTPQGQIEVDQHWSDFHAVNGLQYPYHNLIYHDGDKFSETTVQDVKTNITLDAALFTKPVAPPPPPAPSQ